MFLDDSGTLTMPPTEATERGTPPSTSWGTSTLFEQLSGASHKDGEYWVRYVSRPAHRLGHPRLNISGCPGCAYETAAS
jgi:hypothetical protein